MVNEADEGLKYEGGGEKPILQQGAAAPTKYVLRKESSWDKFHKQRESQWSSAGKQFWQKEEFAKQRSKNLSHCRGMSLHPGQEN